MNGSAIDEEGEEGRERILEEKLSLDATIDYLTSRHFEKKIVELSP